MKSIIFFMLICLSFTSYSKEKLFAPIQKPFFDNFISFKSEMLASITEVKVKVFPHNGTYTTPQGAESRMDQVRVKSDGLCSLITPDSKQVVSEIILKAKDFLQGSGSLKCDAPISVIRQGAKTIKYRGQFSLYNKKGNLLIVNHVSMNDYLKGVVPTEVYSTWPLEALKAQATASRTYAVNQILHARRVNPNNIYEIDDTVMYQAYLGMNREKVATSKAVEQTDGVYLTDGNGKVIIAYFSDDSGGYTETAQNVWGGSNLSYTPSKPEVYDLDLVKSKWTKDYTLAQIEARLIKHKIVSKEFQLADMEIIENTISGRMKKIKLIGRNGAEIYVYGESLRHGLALRSSLVKMTKTSNNLYHFDGLGWGHGVGMCQEGSMVLAHYMGWDYKQILSFYYEGVNF